MNVFRLEKENTVMKCLLKPKMIVVVLLTMNYLLSGCAVQDNQFKHVGRVAITAPGKINLLKRQYSTAGQSESQKLKDHDIYNHSVYLKDLGEATPAVFGFFETKGNTYDAKILPGEKNLHWTDMEEVFYFAGKTDVAVPKSKVQRVGMVIGLRPRMVESYKLLHKYSWPEVLQKIYEGNIRNYSIYLHKLKDKYYLFSYFEYVGDDFDADMAMIDNEPATIAWIKFTDKGCQLPIPTRDKGEWWAVMEEIFHCD